MVEVEVEVEEVVMTVEVLLLQRNAKDRPIASEEQSQR